MDINEEVAPEKPKSKKRKKEADSDAAEEKVLILRNRFLYVIC